MASLTLSLPGRYEDECSIAGLSGWSALSSSSSSASKHKVYKWYKSRKSQKLTAGKKYLFSSGTVVVVNSQMSDFQCYDLTKLVYYILIQYDFICATMFCICNSAVLVACTCVFHWFGTGLAHIFDVIEYDKVADRKSTFSSKYKLGICHPCNYFWHLSIWTELFLSLLFSLSPQFFLFPVPQNLRLTIYSTIILISLFPCCLFVQLTGTCPHPCGLTFKSCVTSPNLITI